MKEYQLIHRHLLGNNIKAVAFSHDDNLIAVLSDEVYIGTIDGEVLYKGAPKEDYEKHYWNLTINVSPLAVYQVKWTKDDKFLWCAAEDFYEFSIETLQFRRIYQTDEELKCIAVNDAKELIALAGEERGEHNRIYIFNFKGDLLKTIESQHDGRIHDLYITPDGTKLVSGGYDSYMRVWNIETGEVLDQYKLDDDPRKFYSYATPNQFIAKLRYDTSLFSLDEGGKISLVKNLQNEIFTKKSKGMLGYSPKKNITISWDYFYTTAHFINDQGEQIVKLDTPGQIDFVEVGNTRDIIALVFKYRLGPPEIYFYSTESKATFFGEDLVLDWEVQTTYPKMTGLHLINSYPNYPDKWIGFGTRIIAIYDPEFKELFKTKSDSQIYKADFHSKTQRAVYYELKGLLHIIDFAKMDVDAINAARLNAFTIKMEDLKDVRWNNKGDRIAVLTDKRELIIYDAKLKELARQELGQRAFCLAWSATDDKIALGSDNGILSYYYIAEGIVKEIQTVGLDRIEDITCDLELNEFIATGRRFINVLNQEGFIIRKLDFKTDTQFTFPACRPSSTEFAVYGNDREGHKIYIVDRNKPIRECVNQIIHYHTDWIRILTWENTDRLISLGGKIGLVFWELK